MSNPIALETWSGVKNVHISLVHNSSEGVNFPFPNNVERDWEAGVDSVQQQSLILPEAALVSSTRFSSEISLKARVTGSLPSFSPMYIPSINRNE